MMNSSSRSKWRRTGALVTATVQLQRTATGPNLINTAVENAKMAEKQIRRARGAYAGLFLLMVRIRRSRHGKIAKVAEVVGWSLDTLGQLILVNVLLVRFILLIISLQYQAQVAPSSLLTMCCFSLVEKLFG